MTMWFPEVFDRHSGTRCGQTSRSGSSSPKVTMRPSRIRHVDSTSSEQGLQDRFAIVPADVAASWTSMAIIDVQKQGFWVEEVFSWSVHRHKSAEKQEGECHERVRPRFRH